MRNSFYFYRLFVILAIYLTVDGRVEAENWLFGGEWSSDVSFGDFKRHSASGRWRYIMEDPVPTVDELLHFVPDKLRGENITFAGLYTSLTTGNIDGILGQAASALINSVSHHEFVVMETQSGRGISAEKLDDGLVIQTSDDPAKLVEWQLSYRRKCIKGVEEGPPGRSMTVEDFIRLLYTQGEPTRGYHLINENCTDFVARILDYLGRTYPKFDEVLDIFSHSTCHLRKSFFG
jgi:hypothetical protein